MEEKIEINDIDILTEKMKALEIEMNILTMEIAKARTET